MSKRLLTIGMLTIATLSLLLSGCGDTKAPPEDERAIAISPPGLEGEPGKEYKFSARLIDYPADNYQYEWSVDGSVQQSGSDSSFRTTFAQDGEYTIHLSLKDSAGHAYSAASGTASARVKIQSPVQYAWKLIEIVDVHNREAWATSPADYWQFEHVYSPGNLSATIWHKDDANYVAYGAVAVWSVPPQVIRGGERVTLLVSLSETENTHKNPNSAASAFADFAPPTLALGTRGQIDFADAQGQTAAVVNGAGPTSDERTLTAVAPEGSLGERIAIRVCFYMGASMGTYYVYVWQET